MKHTPLVPLSHALAIGIFFALAQVKSETPPQKTIKTRIGDLNYEAGYPTKETSQKLYDEMDLQRACQAYMWSFPAVSFASVRVGMFRDLGLTYHDIMLYQDFLDPKSIYLTGNSTTIYGAFLRLDGPTEAALDRSWKPGDFEKVK